MRQIHSHAAVRAAIDARDAASAAEVTDWFKEAERIAATSSREHVALRAIGPLGGAFRHGTESDAFAGLTASSTTRTPGFARSARCCPTVEAAESGAPPCPKW